MLAECMREHGGFEHNRQSLRVVELLENAYPKFPGLNLTFEVREGLQKHQAFYDPPAPNEEKYRCPSLEAQIANLADEITYYSHDLDDAVDFEILDADATSGKRGLATQPCTVMERYPEVREPELHKLIIRDIIDVQVQDVVQTSADSIAHAKVHSEDEVRRQPAPLIRYSDELLEANRELRRFLYQNVYYHPRVAKVNERACEMLRSVFEAYVREPNSLGAAATKRIESEGLHRTICDYIAGMTDRYLLEEHARLGALSYRPSSSSCALISLSEDEDAAPTGGASESLGKSAAGFFAQILNDQAQSLIHGQFFEHLLAAQRIVDEGEGHEVGQHLRIGEIGKITIHFCRKLAPGLFESIVQFEDLCAESVGLQRGSFIRLQRFDARDRERVFLNETFKSNTTQTLKDEMGSAITALDAGAASQQPTRWKHEREISAGFSNRRGLA